VASGGTLALITCSIFNDENQMQRDFMSESYPELSLVNELQYLPSAGYDGLYLAVFKKAI
jgi:16S rRNA (cytosine967-C5)-methyltransferase